MASRNPDASANSAPDGFHASAPRDEPLTKTGHQPGKLVGNEAVPEFHAQTLPAGTAPPKSTFQPNNDADATPAQGGVSASSTIVGATSGDVHAGLGQPIQGQSSAELHHDGQSHRKNPGQGGNDGQKTTLEANTVDSRLPENAALHRKPESDIIGGTRSNVPSAEERIPDSA